MVGSTRALAGLALLGLVLAAPATAADCPDLAESIAQSWMRRMPVMAPSSPLSPADGACVQEHLVRELLPVAGAPVGYKVGLTSAAAQKMFGVDSPAAGVLLAEMIKPAGITMPADYGARPVFEPDLLVRVKDAGINLARTPQEVARHLSEVMPFIELADLMVAEGEPFTMPLLTAVNVGARAGIAGRPVPVTPTPDFVAALETMTVVARDQAGRELSRAPGRAILGHPLNAVLWLVRELERRGKALKAGDLVSLGSFAKPAPPPAGHIVTVVYEGLPGAEPVSVRFE